MGVRIQNCENLCLIRFFPHELRRKGSFKVRYGRHEKRWEIQAVTSLLREVIKEAKQKHRVALSCQLIIC